MSKNAERLTEAARLEKLWSGEFGDAYVNRNRSAGNTRELFWRKMMAELDAQTLLEVGCNIGANLQWIAACRPAGHLYGVDVNSRALNELHRNLLEVNALRALGRQLPFRDQCFDMVFTIGVLIHQPEDTLPLVMAEIVRCSRRYVLCGEYFAEETTEVSYRGQMRALFKRNYGRIYQTLFPELRVIKRGFLGREDGWDDVTYWAFQKDE